MKFEKIRYEALNSRQKENYNFQKISAELAEYGFNCLRLSDDWQGADFIACHIDGNLFLKVQQKGRLTIDDKYFGRDIHIAFFDRGKCYVYPHDEVLRKILALNKINNSQSWTKAKCYSWPYLPKWAFDLLAEYRV